MTTTLCSGPPPSMLSIDAIGNDLLTTLLTSLSLESCIPIFHHQTIDVFRWLGMKRPEDFAAIGVDSPGACQTLALFTRALGRHLNGLPPSFDQLQKQVDMDERVRDGHALERTIQHTVALFDQYTRGPAQHQHQQQRSKQKQSVRWSSNLSVLGDSSSSYLRRSPADRDTTTPPIQEAPQSEQDIPPPYATATATSKRKKASILIKRLSLKHRSPRPISMPVSLETHHTSEHTPPSTANRLSTTLARRFSLHHQNSFPSSSTAPPPVANPAHQLLQGQQLQHRHQQVQQHLLLQQQYQKRDHALRQRWEKCRSCVILPREEEGSEELPGYRCTVYKMGHVWVKREMDGPATKSRSRTWRKMYIELWGTVLRFYQVKTHRRFSFYYSSGSDAFKKQQEQQERKHRRQQRRRESSSDDDDDDDPLACYYLNPLANTSTPSLSSSSEGSGSSPITIATHATYNFIKRSYRYSQQYATLTTSTSPPVPTTPPMDTLSLARAEATRAYDYKKRPHVLRLVIDQGPHLLLRLTSHPDMISWIEHLQAAINISLDLELRPMPKFMTLPSRLSTSGSNDPRTLHLERTREQRYRDQYEMLI